MGVLLFFSFLVIPTIFTNGYMLRIMKYSFEGSKELPPFNEWLNMFVDGLKVIIVNVIYTFIPAIITAVITIAIVMSMLFNGVGPDYYVFYNTFLKVLLVVGIIVITVPYIFSLMALPHIVRKDKLDVLLELRNLLNIIRGIGWSKFISAVVLLVVLNIPFVVGILSSIPAFRNTGNFTNFCSAEFSDWLVFTGIQRKTSGFTL